MSGITLDSLGFTHLTLVCLNSQGNFLWEKKYGNSKFQYLDNTFHLRGPTLKDGNFFYQALSVRDSASIQIGVLLKFDFNGDTLWQKIYRDSNLSDGIALQAITRSKDGGFLITGYYYLNNPCLVIKTDANGNELWHRRIGTNVRDGQSIVEDSATKKIIIVGYQNIYGGAASNILILDSSGVVQYENSYNNSSAGGFREVIQLKDKNFLACGSYRIGFDTNGFAKLRGFIVKFDIDGNVICSKMYDVPSRYNSIDLLHELQDGNLILAGTLDTMINAGYEDIIKMKIIKTDKNGDIKWNRYVGGVYKSSDGEFMRSINPTHDGGFIITPLIYSAPAPRPYKIVKIDSTACDTLEQWCRKITVGINEQSKMSGYNFEFFPNPANDFVSLKLNASVPEKFTIKLYELNGYEIKTMEIGSNETFKFSTASFKDGFYFLSIYYQGRLVETKKLLVVH